MNFIQKIIKRIQESNDDEYVKEIALLTSDKYSLQEEVKDLRGELDSLQSINGELLSDNHELISDLEDLKKDVDASLIDSYMSSKYKKIKDISYKNKRAFKGKEITMTLNELITPNSYEVKKFKKYDDLQKQANLVSKHLKWTDDKQFGRADFYLYPNEVIVSRLDDCEGHAFVMASLFPNRVGVCYGFHGSTGHAFNCFVENNELYVLETTGDSANIVKYSDQDKYKIHYVITKDNTYCVKAGVHFGKIAYL